MAETSLINLEEVKKRLERDIEAKSEHIDQLETKLLAAQSEIEKQGEQLTQSLKHNQRLEKQILELRKTLKFSTWDDAHFRKSSR